MIARESQQISQTVALDIIKKFWEIANFRDFMKKHFTQYCYTNSVKYVEKTLDQQFRIPQIRDPCPQQKQPQPLYSDNFFPGAADIDEPESIESFKNSMVLNVVKKSIRQPTQQSQSRASKTSKKLGSKAFTSDPYEKLDLPSDEEQEAIYRQLRKDCQQKRKKQEVQNQLKKKKEIRPKKGGKEQKISYDYNGEVVKIRNQNRNNLVSGGLEGQTLLSVEKVKEVNKNVPPTKIQFQKKMPIKPALGKINQIQFTDIRTLFSEASVKKGIKLSEGGVTIEQKIKKLSIKELKESLSGRKLSKEDYKRIKQSTGNISQFDDLSRSNLTNSLKSSSKMISQENQLGKTDLLRSASESKFNESRILIGRKSTITVSDPQLLDQLLNGPINQAQEKQIKKVEEPETKVENKLDSIDNYNLLYMKKGSSLDFKKKSKSIADLTNIKLPKLHGGNHHQNILGSYQTVEMPRVREKLKDQNNILLNIRKKFDDKLRL